MTHSKLVRLAVDYLKMAKGCNPVFAERGSARISEMPDAIGWTATDCFVVECKTSLEDLKADVKKPCRKKANKGMGYRRFYLVTEKLYNKIKINLSGCIPKGWGLLVVWESRGVRQQLASLEFKSNIRAERDFLRSRILQVQRFGR